MTYCFLIVCCFFFSTHCIPSGKKPSALLIINIHAPYYCPQRNCQCKDYLKKSLLSTPFIKNTLTSSDPVNLVFPFYYFTLYHTQMQKNVLTCDIAPYNVLKCGLTKINNNNLSLQNMQTISE